MRQSRRDSVPQTSRYYRIDPHAARVLVARRVPELLTRRTRRIRQQRAWGRDCATMLTSGLCCWGGGGGGGGTGGGRRGYNIIYPPPPPTLPRSMLYEVRLFFLSFKPVYCTKTKAGTVSTTVLPIVDQLRLPLVTSRHGCQASLKTRFAESP